MVSVISSNSTNAFGYRELYVNSKDRDTGTSDNFTVNLPTSLSFTQMYIKSVILPISYYNIPASANTFNLQLVTSGSFNTYTIPAGNYTIGSLVVAMNTAMTGSLVTVTANTAMNTITFSNAGQLTIQATTSAQFQLLQILGFASNDTDPAEADLPYTYSGARPTTTLTSFNVVNLGGPQYLNIKSDGLADATPVPSSYTTSGSENSIFAQIPTNTGFSIVAWLNQSDLRFNIDNSIIFQTLDFRLEGPWNIPVDLNGIDWSFVIGFYS
jgi:hypothetical protein